MTNFSHLKYNGSNPNLKEEIIMGINLTETVNNFNHFLNSRGTNVPVKNRLSIALNKKDACGSFAAYTTDDKNLRASLKEINQFASNILAQGGGNAEDFHSIAYGLEKIHDELKHKRKSHTIFQRIWFWIRGGESILFSTKQLAILMHRFANYLPHKNAAEPKVDSKNPVEPKARSESSSEEVKNPEPATTPSPEPTITPSPVSVAKPVTKPEPASVSDLFLETLESVPELDSTDISDIRDYFVKNSAKGSICRLTAYPAAIAVFLDFKHEISEKDQFERKYSKGLVVVINCKDGQITFPDRNIDTICLTPLQKAEPQPVKKVHAVKRNILDDSSSEEEEVVAPTRYNVNPFFKQFSNCQDVPLSTEEIAIFNETKHINDLPGILSSDPEEAQSLKEQQKTQWLLYRILSNKSFIVQDTIDLFGKVIVGNWTFSQR